MKENKIKEIIDFEHPDDVEIYGILTKNKNTKEFVLHYANKNSYNGKLKFGASGDIMQREITENHKGKTFN